MNQPPTKASPELFLRTMRILWGSFLVCVGLFVLVTRITRPANSPAAAAVGSDPLLYVLGLLAVVVVAASFYLKGIFYRRGVEQQQPLLVQAGFILAMAFCEAGVLMGLVGIFVTRNDVYYLLFALGALGMLLHFPRREQVEAAYQKGLR